MNLATLVSFAGAVIVLNLIPGPGMMFILAHGIGGRRSGLVAALGMAAGTVVHTVAAALGLSALLNAAPYALDVVRIAGALVLVYMAVEALRSARYTEAEVAVTVERSWRRTFASAVLNNLANPKLVLFYLAFVPQFVVAGGWPVPSQILTLGAILVLIGLVMDCGTGLAAAALSAVLIRRPAMQRWLKRASATIFGALAAKLLADEH